MPRGNNPADVSTYVTKSYDNKTGQCNVEFGNLNGEILSTGNVTVIKAFIKNNAAHLTENELNYLNLKLRAQEAFERERGKQWSLLTTGEDKPLPQLKEENGFLSLSGIKLNEQQTSFNGCWSCASSLLLKSRGVELSQEQIRSWMPNYESSNGKSLASNESLIERNSDTPFSIEDNADLFTEVSPNTSLHSMNVLPFEPSALKLKDENGKLVEPTPEEKQIVMEDYKRQIEEDLQKKITSAIIDHSSPVALLYDNHTITVTGINLDNGMLQIQDSLGDPIEREMTIKDIVHDSLEPHERYTSDGVPVPDAKPTGLSITWLQELNATKKEVEAADVRDPQKSVKKDVIDVDLGAISKCVTVDGEGKIGVDIPPNDNLNFIEVGKQQQGVINSKGVEYHENIDSARLKGALNGKEPSYYGEPLPLAQTTVILPKKVRIKGAAPEREAFMTAMQPYAQDASEIINTVDEPTKSMISEKRKASPKYKAAEDSLDEILGTMIGGPKENENNASIEALKGYKKLPELLTAKMENGNTYLQELTSVLPPYKKASLMDSLCTIDNYYGLGTDFRKALGTKEPVYSADLKHEYKQEEYLRKINEHIAADDQKDTWYANMLGNIVAEEMLWQSGYGKTHMSTEGKGMNSLPNERIKKNIAVLKTIEKNIGFKEFVKDAKSPKELFGRFMTQSHIMGIDKEPTFSFEGDEVFRDEPVKEEVREQPQYQAPQQPQYQAPQQPRYQAPQQPRYQAPQQPQYQAPQQPRYQAPQQPQFFQINQPPLQFNQIYQQPVQYYLPNQPSVPFAQVIQPMQFNQPYQQPMQFFLPNQPSVPFAQVIQQSMQPIQPYQQQMQYNQQPRYQAPQQPQYRAPQQRQQPQATQNQLILKATVFETIDRGKMIKDLEAIKKKLEAKHTLSFIGGGASDEMKDLRNSVDKVIKGLKDGKKANEIKNDFNQMQGYAGVYANKKKEDSIRYSGQKDWKPLSGMGRTRLNGAEDIQGLSFDSYSKKNIVLKDPQDSLAAIHEAAIERDPQANVDDLKKQLKEVIADVIARPNMFKNPKAPNLTELVKDNVEYKYKTIGEAFIGEKNKIKERRDLQAMLNGIKKAGDLVTMCDKIHQETLNATSASAKMELNEVNKRMGSPENNNNVAQKTVHRNNERQFGK